MIGRLMALVAVAAGAVLALAGCQDTPAPAAAPTTVVVNTPPADGGQMVLLTVMVGAAFLALIAAGAFAWVWAQERRARRDAEVARREAEDAVLALTGQPLARVRFELFAHDPGTDPTARPGDYSPPRGRRAIQGWPE
jgi:heme/copper-type cytochrome/quinol oxidase subunit 2